jgi:tetraacyldisaccharide 4'-kinase
VPSYLWARNESTGRRALLAPLWLAEGPYRLGAWLHRRLYDWGLWRRIRLPARVISIGNLTVGGSGKTPFVGWLAERLRARGEKVAILSRGVHAALSARVNVVSDGERVLLAPADVGDEPVWLASHVPGVPVLAGRNRVALGLRASAVFGTEILLLDDGFQHHRVERDLDLVCVDAEVGLGNGHVLPRGPLREPSSALRSADAIVWTRCSPDAETPPRDRRLPPALPRFHARMVPVGLRALGGAETRALETLRNQRVGLLTAIARPQAVKRVLEDLGADVVKLSAYPDHHLYRRGDIDSLDPALLWVTTGKDAVKLPSSWSAGRRLMVLEEKVEVEHPRALIEWVIEHLGSGTGSG